MIFPRFRRIRPIIRHSLKLAFLAALFTAGFYNISAFLNAVKLAHLHTSDSTPLFVDRNGEYISDAASENGSYGYWQLPDAWPVTLISCVLASEDKRFYEHQGADLRSIARALFNNLSGNSVQGASTIAMQVARLQNPSSRSFQNKLIEMYTALILTRRYGRETVLKHYLAIAPQGSGMYGFAYSARRYFQKPVNDLSWAEAALLTSMLRSPGEFNLFKYAGFIKAKRRAKSILNLAFEQEYIDRETYDISLSHLYYMRYQYREKRPENSYHYILRLLDNPDSDPAQNPPSFPAGRMTDSIRTSLDLNLQQYLQKVSDFAMDKYRHFGAHNIAAMVVDKETGEVLGYIGSHDYFDKKYKGSINYAAVPRSTGSTLKPFLFALGLMSGNFTPSSVLADLPFHILSPSGEYTAGNFDNEYMGPMLYRRALGNSRNVPTLRILETTGIDRTYTFFKNLGLIQFDKTAEYYGYSLVLGGVYVSLETLIEAYGVLANNGTAFKLQWTKIQTDTTAGLDANAVQSVGKTYLISESAARQVSMYLSDPLARLPSFQRLSTMDYPFPVALKTGTSQGFRDAWAVAYSSEYIVGVWMGHPDNERMNHVTGSVVSGLVQRIFMYLQPEKLQGIEEEPFPPPRDSIPARICIYSGELASDHCPEISVEYFDKGREPHSICSVHRQFVIDKRTGSLALMDSRPDQVELVTRAVFPPQYSAWAFKQGYEPPPSNQVLPANFDIHIVSPLSGSKLIIDPELPRKFQSVPLRAEVSPAIASIVWYVDGEPYTVSSYPYEERWQLEEGTHIFQAKFGRAKIFSNKVEVKISSY